MPCYKISYMTKNETPCTVVVEAPNAYIAKTWFAEHEHKQNRLGVICGCYGELYCSLYRYQQKDTPFIEAKTEEITTNWWNADVSDDDLASKLVEYLKENNIYYELSDDYSKWHFECLCDDSEELMLDRFWEEIVSE